MLCMLGLIEAHAPRVQGPFLAQRGWQVCQSPHQNTCPSLSVELLSAWKAMKKCRHIYSNQLGETKHTFGLGACMRNNKPQSYGQAEASESQINPRSFSDWLHRTCGWAVIAQRWCKRVHGALPIVLRHRSLGYARAYAGL
jgi:hypothetical protein